MAVSKVVFDGDTLMDLTADTVSAETLAEGATAHDAAGNAITGTMKAAAADDVVYELTNAEFEILENGCYLYWGDSFPGLEAGRLYRVTMGGKAYLDTACEIGGEVILGNYALYSIPQLDGHQPYCFAPMSTGDIRVYIYTGGTDDLITASIKIEKVRDDFVCLDQEVTQHSGNPVSAQAVYSAIDKIVEQGTSGIWTYRKYESGIAECWGSKNYKGSTSTTWGSLYTLSCTPPTYPLSFTAKPVVTRDLTQNTGTSCWLTGWSAGSVTSMGTFALVRTSSGTVDVDVNFHVIGKWK